MTKQHISFTFSLALFSKNYLLNACMVYQRNLKRTVKNANISTP